MAQTASVISPTQRRKDYKIVFFRDGGKIFTMDVYSSSHAATLQQLWREGANQADIAQYAKNMGLKI